MDRDTTKRRIDRGYLDVGGVDDSSARRCIHYYRSGSGPPLLMLHPSPMSAAALLPVLERVSRYATAVAIDTPGYGLSDPLEGPVDDLSPYADAVDRFRRAANIDRMMLFGSATGAQIAIEYAKRYPRHCHSLILDNAADFPASERDRLLDGYFPDLSVDFSGAHLARIWTMALDLLRFFPWHLHTADATLPGREIDVEMVQSMVLPYLQAGAGYHRAYRAAFVNEEAERLLAVPVPTTVIRSSGSIIKNYADRLDRHQWPDHIRMHHCGASIAERQQAIEDAVAASRNGLPDAEPAGQDTGDGRRIVAHRSGNVSAFVRRGAGTAWIVLHDIGASADAEKEFVDALAEIAPVLAPDLPGHGATDAANSDATGYVPAACEMFDDLTETFGFERVDLVAIGASAPLALHYCGEARHPPGRLILVNPEGYAERLAFEPAIDGSHLLALWHRLRERELYAGVYPWSAEDRLDGLPDLAPERVNRRLIDRLRSDAVYDDARNACRQLPVPETTRDVPVPTTIARSVGTAAADRSRRRFPDIDGADTLDLPSDPARWAAALLDHATRNPGRRS